VQVVRGYKTELDLNNEQRTACLKHAGCARFAYNWGLARSQEVSRATGKRPTPIDLHKDLNKLKQTDYPWMYEVSKCAPQEALRDLDTAYKNFYRRAALKKQGKFKGKIGFPTFKKRSKGIGSFRLTGAIKVFEGSVQLPRIGRVRLHERGYIPTDAKILSATVSEHAGRWFVSVQLEEEQEQPACTLVPPANAASQLAPLRQADQKTATTAIGVDLGIKTLATCSDGMIFENPRALKHAQKKLRRLERQKSRRKKGSKNRAKTCRKLARQHARIANIRKDASHKLTSYLCKNHTLIAIEDLHVAGMLKNHCLAQAVADSNFGEMRRQFEYKARWHGIHLVVIDRFSPSSQTCSCCKWRAEGLTLADRVFVCLDCGYVADRDYNAAKNIRNVAASSIDTQNASGGRSAGPYSGRGETALVEVGTKGDVWALSQMSMF
jgi:putative transposase